MSPKVFSNFFPVSCLSLHEEGWVILRAFDPILFAFCLSSSSRYTSLSPPYPLLSLLFFFSLLHFLLPLPHIFFSFSLSFFLSFSLSLSFLLPLRLSLKDSFLQDALSLILRESPRDNTNENSDVNYNDDNDVRKGIGAATLTL